MRISPLKLKLAAVLTASATAAALGVGVTTAPAGATAPTMSPHRVKVIPDIRKISGNTDAAQFTCQGRPIDGSKGIVCYDPSQIQTAYGFAPLLAQGKNGTGRTIVIVDAFQNPYIAAGPGRLRPAVRPARPDLRQHRDPGTPAFDPTDDTQVGWAEETTLDVLWAHAVAPGAKIRLVSAASSNDTDILAATQFAVDNRLGDVLSQSFGENENCVDPDLLAAQHRCSPRPPGRAGPSSLRPVTQVRPSSPATTPARSRLPATRPLIPW